MSDNRRRTIIITAIAAVVVYALLTAIAALLISTYSTTHTLKRSSDRSECAREVNANIQEQFDHGITALLNAAVTRDVKQMNAAVVALRHIPNAQDVIMRTCPAGLTGGG